MTTKAMIGVVLVLANCEPSPIQRDARDRVTAARALTHRYAQSRFAAWAIDAHAIGDRCEVLGIETSMILEDTLIEMLHTGAGAYAVMPGGVKQYAHDASFRGIAYRDRSGRVWKFGNVSIREARTMKPCAIH